MTGGREKISDMSGRPQPGFVLIHGYTGSPGDMAPLAAYLTARFGEKAVASVRLPGHGAGRCPRFDTKNFIAAIAEKAVRHTTEGRALVLIGHSTGGILALHAIAENGLEPAALVLAAVPKKVDGSGLKRWEYHRAGGPEISLPDVARMVSLINRVGNTPVTQTFPVFVLHGEDDPLVPAMDAQKWYQHGFRGKVRKLLIPDAGHNLFEGKVGTVAADFIGRSITDRMSPPLLPENERSLRRLIDMEGGHLNRFVNGNPAAKAHLLNTPSVKRALDIPFLPAAEINSDPLQLNIEITTRCNMKCAYCARTVSSIEPRDMSEGVFQYVLDLLPNSYRVTLAGLGEPTLHPRIFELVRHASDRNRYIALVTNAVRLDCEYAIGLIAAGLKAVTFSLDSIDGSSVSVHPGVHTKQVLSNIREFMARAAGVGIDTAVFTAVSRHTVAQLPQLADVIVSLGVKAWMLTDLNFKWNQSDALAGHFHADAKAAVKAALRVAFAHKLPVLSVNGLETFGMAAHYRKFLLYPPERLSRRSHVRNACVSPWQTLPVDVDGNVVLCDCQPDALCGSLLREPFEEIWNKERLRDYRSRMITDTPPEPCRICPRF